MSNYRINILGEEAEQSFTLDLTPEQAVGITRLIEGTEVTEPSYGYPHRPVTIEMMTDVDAVVGRIRKEVLPVWGIQAFGEDPGGMLAYHGFTEDDETCAAAIRRVLDSEKEA